MEKHEEVDIVEDKGIELLLIDTKKLKKTVKNLLVLLEAVCGGGVSDSDQYLINVRDVSCQYLVKSSYFQDNLYSLVLILRILIIHSKER